MDDERERNNNTRNSKAFTDLQTYVIMVQLETADGILKVFQYMDICFMCLSTITSRGERGTIKNFKLQVTVGGATNESALFWKQRRDDLPIGWKQFSINPTTIVGVLSRLNLH